MENPSRNPYPSDVTDDEWWFVAPYLTLSEPAVRGLGEWRSQATGGED